MGKVIIRKATTGDASQISDVLIRSITELCASDHLDDPELIAGWIDGKSPRHIEKWIDSGAIVLVSSRENQILAVAGYLNDGTIQRLYVSPEARGEGHSSALLTAMEEGLKDIGMSEARLTSSKTAEGFYLKRGWVIAGERVACYTTDGQPMRKQLIPTQN